MFRFPSLHGFLVGLACLLTAAGTAAGAEENASGIEWEAAQRQWPFKRPQAEPVPAVRQTEWPRQELDYFVLRRLEQEGLAPTEEAAPQVLLRRVTFDLTGLPPTLEELEAFLSDRSEEAYERVVDRLLASPQFGERLTSLWLNLARYAEDQAHQVGSDRSKFYPNAYHYRSWVIDAFNRDLPYDQFIRLQLAADLVAPDQSSDAAALGFIGLGPKYYNRGRLEVMADEWEDRVDTVARTFLGLTVACARCHDHKYDPITMEDYYALAGVFASTRLVDKHRNGEKYKPPKDKKEREKADLPEDVVHVLEEGEVKDLNVFARGDVGQPGAEVPRRFPRILCQGEPEPFQEGSGRRELAEAIADPNNPLTARVMVNRLWGMVFGHPLVATPSNFGALAEPPSHPALLDALAVGFVEDGWSIKRLVRRFVLSSTYRQSSSRTAQARRQDPANQWLAGMNRQRLTVEQWRDSLLAVGGNLDLTDGPSLKLDDPGNVRRTVQARISRLSLNELLVLFDYPDPNVHAPRRSVTTTATQKLYVLNAPFMLRQAELLATRLAQSAGSSDQDRIRQAYQLLYARLPTEEELQLGLKFLNDPEEEPASRWTQYAHVLLAANETLYVD